MTARRITIRKGLDVPIAGVPEPTISEGPRLESVALLGSDYPGMKPTMEVRVGERVKLGQVLFADKKTPGVHFTSPGAGTVAEINRGPKRVFESMVIRLEGEDEETFEEGVDRGIEHFDRDAVREKLVASGLWTALRTRPYSKIAIAAPGSAPHSIFVTATDTNPLATPPEVVLREAANDFAAGVRVLAKLSGGKTFVCVRRASVLPGDLQAESSVEVVEFEGPHPAGLAGTHIHLLDPVGPRKTVWTVGYQDVIAAGRLFTAGRLSVERVVALGGPSVRSPRLLRTRVGANLLELTRGELVEGEEVRIVSGSLLCGHRADGPFAYLGRYHLQVAALPEGREREFLGWLTPGLNKFSLKRAFASCLAPGKRFRLTTNVNGSPRAIVPLGSYERVMPLDIEATYLLRALASKDTDQSQNLGCLELDEEDLALCTFVCTGKYDYGPLLRDTLTTIEREG